MEGEEPDEKVVVSVTAEAPLPEESALSGSDSALPQPEGDARPHEVKLWNCILQMETAKFNSALKGVFVSLLGAVLISWVAFYQNTLSGYGYGGLRSVGWLFGVFTGDISVTIAVLAALFALCVDVERPGFKRRPAPQWMVELLEWTDCKLRKCYNTTAIELPTASS